MFVKTEVVFYKSWNEEWIEVKLYRSMKEFLLMIFSSSLTRNDTLKLKSISSDILHFFATVRRSLNQLQRKTTNVDNSITCKLHHMSHYSELTQLFGPLLLFATFHYEHKHQMCKNLCRNIRNFDTLGLTVHKRHQILIGMMEKENNFFTTNFFEELQNTRAIDQLPKTMDCYVKVNYDDQPFKIKKRVLRKILGSRFEFFHTTVFLRDTETNEIFCKGQCMSISISSEESLSKLTPKTIREHRVDIACIQYIPLLSLYHKNDYFFTNVNNDLFLIRMSY